MSKIRKGDIVGRKSYGKDIYFKVSKIIEKISTKEEIAILNGFIERIEADSPVSDLEIIPRRDVIKRLKSLDDKLKKRIFIADEKRSFDKSITGKILHLDGDRKYSEKSYNYYKKVGLNAVVKNIPEYKQPRVVRRLLEIYDPDILVITGHDGMIKRGSKYNDVYNYRNSRYFIETVKEARKYDKEKQKNLVIFAGACQSYFEALISAGANFASSPARILIDFLDPLLVAQKVATTEKYKYITIDDIAYELRDGKNGVSGIGANGKLQKLT